MISTSRLKAQWLEGRARELGSTMQAVFDAIYYGPNPTIKENMSGRP